MRTAREEAFHTLEESLFTRRVPRGDLFCKVVIETPINLSVEQKELIRALEETLKRDATRHAPREEGFFEGVKRFFSGGTQ